MNKKQSVLKQFLVYVFYRRGKNIEREVHNPIDLANHVQKEFAFTLCWCFGKAFKLIKVLIKLILYPFTYLIKGPKNKKSATNTKARNHVAFTRK